MLLLCLGGFGWLGFNLIAKNSEIQQLEEANNLLAQEEYASAISAYDQLLTKEVGQVKSSEKYRLWINRGYAFFGLNKYPEMLESCSKATSVRADAAWGWNCQGEALYHLNQYKAALRAFKQAAIVDGQEMTFWLNQSLILAKLGRYEAAVEISDKAIAFQDNSRPKNAADQSNFAIAFDQKGQSLLKINRHRAALEAFEQALKYAPDYLPAQQGQGIAQYELGQYSQAIVIFKQILQSDDLSPEQQAISWLYQGISQCQNNEMRAAKQALEQVLRLTSDPQAQKIAQAGCGIR